MSYSELGVGNKLQKNIETLVSVVRCWDPRGLYLKTGAEQQRIFKSHDPGWSILSEAGLLLTPGSSEDKAELQRLGKDPVT